MPLAAVELYMLQKGKWYNVKPLNLSASKDGGYVSR
jgi:hypothetical protein